MTVVVVAFGKSGVEKIHVQRRHTQSWGVREKDCGREMEMMLMLDVDARARWLDAVMHILAETSRNEQFRRRR
jgi:hypothetical protein